MLAEPQDGIAPQNRHDRPEAVAGEVMNEVERPRRYMAIRLALDSPRASRERRADPEMR